MSEIYRTLPVTLTDLEKALRGEEMAREHANLGRLQEQKRDQAKVMKEQIDASETRIAELASQVNTGIEHREVRCKEHPSLVRNMVELERCDTGEIIDSRPMRVEERQERMPFEVNVEDADDDGDTKGSTH